MTGRSVYKEALLYRKKGLSIRNIAHTLKISTSTASIWCRNVQLTSIQRKRLADKSKNIKILNNYSQRRKLEKIRTSQDIMTLAKKEINELNKKELFLVGIALYWAEGFKNLKEGRIGFCNSDPKMVLLMIRWFKDTLDVSSEDFIFRIEFNSKHLYRQHKIEQYWCDLIDTSLLQFTKPYIKHSITTKEYKNDDSYFGVLRIKVQKSSKMLIKVLGWIEGIKNS